MHLILLVALIILSASKAEASSSRSLDRIANDPKWHALLHYDINEFLGGRKSAIVDENFFLSSIGRTDPKAELIATIDAFNAESKGADKHALCRFPARAMWLQEKMDVKWTSDVSCPSRDEWMSKRNSADVGLVFATGYLGNPASFFGHLMLHLDISKNADGMDQSVLLDSSINFGADVPTSDGIVKYMAKGLLGGYNAKFTNALFYMNTRIYSQTEMRDLWIYRLALNNIEKRLLVAHLWEIQNVEYEYLFLTQNCASRISRTLEVVMERGHLPKGAPWVAPESVIQAIAKPTASGRLYLDNYSRIPSKRRISEEMYLKLTNEERRAAKSVWPDRDILALNSKTFMSLNDDSKLKVIEVLLSHADYLRKTQQAETDSKIYRRLLLARLEMPQSETSVELDESSPVHSSTPAGRIFVSALHNDSYGSGIRIIARPLHYDLLDGSDVRMPNSSLEIAKAQVDLTETGVRVTKFDIFNITNLNSRTVDLPGTSGMAWYASASADRKRYDCDNCLDLYLNLMVGKSFSQQNVTTYLLAGIQARTLNHTNSPVAPSIKAGLIARLSDRHRMVFQTLYAEGFAGSESRFMRSNIQYRYELDSSKDFRISVENDGRITEYVAGISLYF